MSSFSTALWPSTVASHRTGRHLLRRKNRKGNWFGEAASSLSLSTTARSSNAFPLMGRSLLLIDSLLPRYIPTNLTTKEKVKERNRSITIGALLGARRHTFADPLQPL